MFYMVMEIVGLEVSERPDVENFGLARAGAKAKHPTVPQVSLGMSRHSQ